MAKDDGHKGRRIDGDGVCEGRQPEFPPMKRGFMSLRHCFEDGVRWSILCQFTSAHARHRRRNDCIHFRDYCCRSRVPPPCHVEPLSRQRKMSFNRRDRECRFCTEIVIPRFPSDRLITLPRIAPNITLIQSLHLHRNGHLYVMHLLLQHSADPNLRDSQGFNTLHLATHSSDESPSSSPSSSSPSSSSSSSSTAAWFCMFRGADGPPFEPLPEGSTSHRQEATALYCL